MSVVRTCRWCGEHFIIPEGERLWYEKRRLALPTHCVGCRAKLKEIKTLKRQRELEEFSLI